MNKLKKILAIVVLLFFVVQSATMIIPAQQEAGENENLNTYEEFEYPVTEFPPKSEYALSLMDPDPEPPMSFENLPSQFSWKSYGGDWTTPAKDQGNCGSCWAFGALGGLEASINIKSGYPNLNIDLSEQYVLACLSAAGSCSGGWMSEAIAYIQSTSPGSTGNGINGCPIESCMPYQGVDYIPCSSKCENWDYYTSPPGADNILWQVNGYGVTSISEDDPNGWNLLKTWVYTYGPIVVDIYTGGWSSYWSSHHDPNDVYENDDSGITNHAQLLCGWVDDPEITNGGYWIIKNSWGTSWGYGGFSNIAYGCNSLGTRDVTWVEATPWPQGQGGPGPVDVDMAVFSNFDYETDDGIKYAHPGDEITFTDISDGDVALREWDLNGDGVVDSNNKMPSYTYDYQGEYEVKLTVHSEWGLQSNRTKIIEVKNIWAPIPMIPSEFTGNGLSYSFDARYSYDPDGGTITDYNWDFDDGSSSDEIYTTHTFPEADRIYEVELTVTDNDGATGSKTCLVKIDQNVPPETEIHHGIGAFNSDWYSETQRVFFSATDWTSVVDTYYRIDDGTWTKYIPQEQTYIPIAGDGQHTVEAYSIDYWGNEETPVVDTFSIDQTDPTVDVTISGAEQENGWYTDDVTVSISADDDLSGISKIMYQVDFGPWQEYNSPVTITEGSHYINALAVDNAGNSVEQTEQIKVDMSPPKTTCILNGQGNDNRFYQSVEIRIVGSDTGSGIKESLYQIDNQPAGFNVYYQPMIIDELGTHTIEYYSIDNIGNIGETKTETFTISNVNFDLHITEPENALYIFGIKLIPTSQPILIGKGTVTVNAEPFTTDPANIQQIEIQLDGETQITTTQSIYTWRIDQSLMGKHTITIKATTNNEETITKEITGTFLLF